MIARSAVLAGFALSVFGGGSAFAASYTSSYSDLKLDRCPIVEEESEIGFVQMRCEGKYGYDVYATEADLRLYLTFRQKGAPLVIKEAFDEEEVGVDVVPTDEIEIEAVGEEYVPTGAHPIGETIPPFNQLGPKIEWRVARGSASEPFATIVRYYYHKALDDGGYGTGQVLVVSRFRDGDSCHVAYVDALANANANVMARDVADTHATGGECPDGAVPVLGSGGNEFRY